jgi:dihydroflavonol-4-reductase
LASQRWAYRSTKAKRELGWEQSPHEETLERTVAWWREREGSKLKKPGTRQPIALRALGGTVDRLEAAAGMAAR